MRKPRSHFFHLSGAQLREIDELMTNFPSAAEVRRKARSLGLSYDQLLTAHARYRIDRARRRSMTYIGVQAYNGGGGGGR